MDWHLRAHRAVRSMLAVLLVAGALASCSMHRELIGHPPADASAAGPDWHATQIARRSHRIWGYRTLDGVEHRCECTVRLNGDSLEFTPVSSDAEATHVVRPATDVSAVGLYRASAAGILIAGALALTLAMVAHYGYGL